MLPSRHVAIGAAVALACAPWLGSGSLGLWGGSVLIDVDHYLWYAIHRRDLSLPNAYRYFRAIRAGTIKPRGNARPLHGPINVLWLAVVAWRWPVLRPVLLGVILHSLLDAYAEERINSVLPAILRAPYAGRPSTGGTNQRISEPSASKPSRS